MWYIFSSHSSWWRKFSCLARVDAYESYGKRKTELGKQVKQYVKELIEGKRFSIILYRIGNKFKKGKYGRHIADIQLENGTLLSDHLVEKKFAKYVKY